MILYTHSEINYLITMARDKDELQAVYEYLVQYKKSYSINRLYDWMEDIRLLSIIFKTQ